MQALCGATVYASVMAACSSSVKLLDNMAMYV